MPAFVPDVPYHIQGVFIVTFTYIWFSAFYGDPDYLEPMPQDPTDYHRIAKDNVWRAIYSIVLFMLAFAYCKPYQEIELGQPSQRVNRLVLMLTLLYTCWLIFMLQMRPDFGRASLGFLDSRLNKPVTKEMHTYDDNCEFEWKNIWDNMDHYYIVHLCNWFLASLVIRDPYVLHFWQLLDEVVELSVQHILPHFRECWWDHIIMDILLSNIPAITAGMFVLRWAGIREYDWLGRKDKETFWDWGFLHCHKKFGVFFYQQVLLLIHFVNGFFLNNAFLIMPKHFFPIARLLMWFGFGAVAHRESYNDSETWNTPGRKDRPISGRYRWLSVGILTTELITCYKYRKGTGNLTDDPTPFYIWGPWTLTLAGMTGYWLYLRFKPGHTVKYPGIEHETAGKKSPSRRRSGSRSPSPRRASGKVKSR